MNTTKTKRTVQIAARSLYNRVWTPYQRHVAENGHVPGVLSGAELEGSAKDFAGRYAASRASVEAVAELKRVRSALGLCEDRKRYVRVWVSTIDGEPVRLTIA